LRPDVFVSVNLSGRQLAQPDLIDVVERCLARAGAAPAGLHVELTETVLLRDVDAAVRRLELLRRTGVRLSLDDFGTGYSSLSYLTRFPIDVVKIDRSFVSQLGVDERDSSVVTMIVGMARTLGLVAVAEGVESETQLRVLRDLGCAQAQGYLFAKPQPASDAEVML
jgi:EAL domain-containing protein (putative c-di-GMP-specific phosphodiesterase class I)